MVRSFISAIIVIAILFSISIGEQYLLRKNFGEFKESAVCVYKKIEDETAVKEDVLSLQKQWLQKKETLHLFIPHNDIKEVELWIAEACTLVENKEFLDALAKIDVVIELSEQIPKMYTFAPQNIF
ncbi:MAG: DUF4363 family protein [Clostridia bacterium]|nr:DUF4363 family protein [Clostridia bacterium]